MPDIGVTVDGVRHDDEVEAWLPLARYLRERVGGGGVVPPECETAECGGCTVLVDGAAVKSCLMLAVQADGCAVTTVEGLADDLVARPLARALRRHAQRCARCLPGLVVAATDLLRNRPDPSEQEIHEGLAGVRCRCGDDADVVRAVRAAADSLGVWGARWTGVREVG